MTVINEKVKTFSNKFEKVFGADNQIRTGDLILTKDVLYQLSHISKLRLACLPDNDNYYIL